MRIARGNLGLSQGLETIHSLEPRASEHSEIEPRFKDSSSIAAVRISCPITEANTDFFNDSSKNRGSRWLISFEMRVFPLDRHGNEVHCVASKVAWMQTNLLHQYSTQVDKGNNSNIKRPKSSETPGDCLYMATVARTDAAGLIESRCFAIRR